MLASRQPARLGLQRAVRVMQTFTVLGGENRPGSPALGMDVSCVVSFDLTVPHMQQEQGEPISDMLVVGEWFQALDAQHLSAGARFPRLQARLPPSYDGLHSCDARLAPSRHVGSASPFISTELRLPKPAATRLPLDCLIGRELDAIDSLRVHRDDLGPTPNVAASCRAAAAASGSQSPLFLL